MIRAQSPGPALETTRKPPTSVPALHSGPGGQETPSPSALGRVALPLENLVGGNCTKPLKNSLDFGLARLRRHFLSFPDTTATDRPRRGPIRDGEGGLTAPVTALPCPAHG